MLRRPCVLHDRPVRGIDDDPTPVGHHLRHHMLCRATLPKQKRVAHPKSRRIFRCHRAELPVSGRKSGSDSELDARGALTGNRGGSGTLARRDPQATLN